MMQGKPITGKKIVRPLTARVSANPSPSKKQFPKTQFDNVRASLQQDLNQPKIDFTKLDKHNLAEQIVQQRKDYTYSLIKPASIRRCSQDRTKSSIDFTSYGQNIEPEKCNRKCLAKGTQIKEVFSSLTMSKSTGALEFVKITEINPLPNIIAARQQLKQWGHYPIGVTDEPQREKPRVLATQNTNRSQIF